MNARFAILLALSVVVGGLGVMWLMPNDRYVPGRCAVVTDKAGATIWARCAPDMVAHTTRCDDPGVYRFLADLRVVPQAEGQCPKEPASFR